MRLALSQALSSKYGGGGSVGLRPSWVIAKGKIQERNVTTCGWLPQGLVSYLCFICSTVSVITSLRGQSDKALHSLFSLWLTKVPAHRFAILPSSACKYYISESKSVFRKDR